jgi:hypothetical protein
MAQQKKEEMPILTTAVGTLFFPYLRKPRAHKDAPDKLAYDTGFLLSGAAADELIAKVDAWAKQSEAENKLRPGDKPYQEHTDKERNVIPGVTRFKFKLRTGMKLKDGSVWNRKPKIVDSQGNPVPESVRLTTGTRARIKYQPHLATGGNKSWVVLQPLLVQIVELVDSGDDVSIEAYEGGGFTVGGDTAPAAEGAEAPTSGREF